MIAPGSADDHVIVVEGADDHMISPGSAGRAESTQLRHEAPVIT